MDPENAPEPPAPKSPQQDPSNAMDPAISLKNPENDRNFSWIFVGPHGLRAGWLVLLFYCLFQLFTFILGALVYAVAPGLFGSGVSPYSAAIVELIPFFAMVGAGAIMLPIARSKLMDYNLRDSHPLSHFFGGAAVGFLAISLLVAFLAMGHWARVGNQSLAPSKVVLYACVWAIGFLLVGCVEEGTFRCYALHTLVGGINFWWALALVSGLCLYARLFVPGESTMGVYLFALLGLLPCFLLHVRRAETSSFWQAAWGTSTGFGFVHTLNHGENWVGIFAAALVGFVFCVSIWATGSAWWAIGCHAAWDWAETYFYGTADSGFVAPGHLLSTSPAGNPLWSGGTDGPEGSLLIIPIVFLLLAWLLIVYRRPRPAELRSPAATEQLAS